MRLGGKRITVIKPQTYMNLSGEAVGSWLRFLKLSSDRLVVVHDDLDLPLGKIRIRMRGGDGGHRGIKSITANLSSPNFVRVRIGIGRPGGRGDEADYVLSRFSPEEEPLVSRVVERARDAVAVIIRSGVEEAQQKHN